MIALDPIDLGGYKYKAKPGQKGVVPPSEHRKAKAAMRKRAAKQKANEQRSARSGGPGPGVRHRLLRLGDRVQAVMEDRCAEDGVGAALVDPLGEMGS